MLQKIVDLALFELVGVKQGSFLGNYLSFFLYDSIKIIFLLFIMISALGFLRTYISEKKLKSWLVKRNRLLAHFSAATIGAITPFCSCSGIPMFISFIRAGVPIGVSFSFIITSPLINEYLVVLMLGLFGWKITAVYVFFGMLMGIVCGMILGKMNLKRLIVKDMKMKAECACATNYKNLKQRVMFGLNEAIIIVKKLWFWVLIGVGVGALIHNVIPTETINSLVSKGGYFTVPIVTLLGVPMYGGCAGILPIAAALFDKGVPLGTALAFMMAVSALSLPEAIMLKRVMKTKLILIFFGIVTAAIILTGYLLNFLEKFLV
ncbi:MAG: permease [Nanoarchaeota archaeon]|nr:permease [Nanoarchaeota archaeon]